MLESLFDKVASLTDYIPATLSKRETSIGVSL